MREVRAETLRSEKIEVSLRGISLNSNIEGETAKSLSGARTSQKLWIRLELL